MQELELPLYYVLNSGFPEEHVEEITRVLGIHPIQCAVYFSLNQARLASRLSPHTIRRGNEKEAIETALLLAQQSGYPTLVVGTADVLDAVYASGRKEQVASYV